MTGRMPEWLLQPFRRRTWGEVLYALIGLFQGLFGFVFTVVTLALSAALMVTFLGLPLLAATAGVSRWLGSGSRQGRNLLTGTTVPAPPPTRIQRGTLGWIRSQLRDTTAWRARLYLVAKLPVAVVAFVVTVGFLGCGFGGLTYAAWRPFLPCNTDGAGVCHRGAGLGPDTYLDTPARIAGVTVVGLVVLIVLPWALRAVLSVDRILVVSLLGPRARDQRVSELERTRAVAVDDAAATLRRIERDLHDGAQARLVALAMNVGLAKEKLAEDADPAEARRLLDDAHASAKQAVAELRDLARGIHPPVLDAGLDTALQTLAAHSTVPVELHAELAARPDAAIETMAYFCVAELLTNVAKHSGARHAWVDVRSLDGRLHVQVDDDGRGGAHVGGGSGLTGLTERIATVDGRLLVESPVGGPTAILVDLPLHAAADPA